VTAHRYDANVQSKRTKTMSKKNFVFVLFKMQPNAVKLIQ